MRRLSKHSARQALEMEVSGKLPQWNDGTPYRMILKKSESPVVALRIVLFGVEEPYSRLCDYTGQTLKRRRHSRPSINSESLAELQKRCPIENRFAKVGDFKQFPSLPHDSPLISIVADWALLENWKRNNDCCGAYRDWYLSLFDFQPIPFFLFFS